MYTRTKYIPTNRTPMLMVALVALLALFIAACAPTTPTSPSDTPADAPTAAPTEEVMAEATTEATAEATEEPAEEAEATATPAAEEEAAAEDSASPDTLEGVTWQLVEFLNTSDELTTAEAEATITFADGQVSGSAGCNNYFAGYTLEGEQLTIEQAGSTMMACEEPAMSQEQAFLARLTEAASYEIVDGQLQILNADGNLLLAFTQSDTEASSAETDASGAEMLTLEGVDWQLVEFLGADDALTAASAAATITFEEGSVGGSTGCNSFSAGYTVDGQQLTVELGMSTMMACEEAIMAQEQAVLERLAQAASYEIVDGQLHILDADGNVLLAFTELEATALTGVTWVATNYNNGNQAVVGVLEGSELTAVFGEDGSLTGKAGCNNFMTGYTVDGDQITIEPAASTRMMCEEPAGVMEQEMAFVLALETAATFSIQGDVLEMRTADDAMVARFVAN